MADRMTFVELMAIEILEPQAVGVHTYMSKHAAFNPGSGQGYGGHVYCQSVWTASQTVSEGMVIHNVHGYFTLPVSTDRPLFYTVTALSSGRTYCARFVTVRQPLGPLHPSQAEGGGQELGNICFASICSFKKDEEASTDHQAEADLEERYSAVMKGSPDEHKPAPRVDSPWYHRLQEKYPDALPDEFPGLDMRKVDMTEYNVSKPALDWRHLSYYRPIGLIPPDDYNLHACAHLYASDRNSLFIVSNAAGFGDEVGAMGSLSHSVIFHVGSKDLVMREGEWWCQEVWTPRSGGGRGVHESRIWDRNGLHVATTWQDGLVRKAENAEGEKQRLMWIDGMVKMGKIDAEIVDFISKAKL